MLAIIYKNNGQLDSAKIYFERCISESKKIDEEGEESGFQVNAVLFLAQMAETQNKKDEAIRVYEKLLDMKDYGRSHSIAENSLKNLRVIIEIVMSCRTSKTYSKSSTKLNNVISYKAFRSVLGD